MPKPGTLEISIRIPRAAQERYLRGGCFVFAHELRRHVRRECGASLRTMALWVDGVPEHAFLVDPRTGCAYDARGRLPLDPTALGEGSLRASVGEIRPIALAQMRQWARSMDGHNARLDISRHVTIFHEEE
jgi:hypothetical protein